MEIKKMLQMMCVMYVCVYNAKTNGNWRPYFKYMFWKM